MEESVYKKKQIKKNLREDDKKTWEIIYLSLIQLLCFMDSIFLSMFLNLYIIILFHVPKVNKVKAQNVNAQRRMKKITKTLLFKNYSVHQIIACMLYIFNFQT